jgi:hypothetical protein
MLLLTPAPIDISPDGCRGQGGHPVWEKWLKDRKDRTLSGVTYYWEHLGLLDDPGYRARWERKRAEYLAAGIRPYEGDGGPEGTLIETRDDPGGGLDAGTHCQAHR